MEELMREWLEKNAYTTSVERDPSKPLIVDEHDMLHPNPDFDPTGLNRLRGTSFFVNFDPARHFHQMDGQEGDELRRSIVYQLRDRLMSAFDAVFTDDQWLHHREAFKRNFEVALSPTEIKGFNNGEVYMWLRKLMLTEETVFAILRALYEFTQSQPVKVMLGGEEYEVPFYGWGFRYY